MLPLAAGVLFSAEMNFPVLVNATQPAVLLQVCAIAVWDVPAAAVVFKSTGAGGA
jgi:hypothetical protein